MNKDNLVLKDKVNIIPNKKSGSLLNLKNEESLIDYKIIYQSDNFSFFKEKENFIYSEKIDFNQKLKIGDKQLTKEIQTEQTNFNDCLILYDKYIENNSDNKYEILYPEKNFVFEVGELIEFECCTVTDNELIKEEFDNLVWISNIDGLVGVKNKFRTMLSYGKHIISLMNIENQIRVVKDKVEISVVLKENKLPEINK